MFEDLWQVVNKDYLYRDFNGVDWNAVHDEYRQKIAAGLDSLAYYQTLREMIDLLGDDHSNYFSPDDVEDLDAEYAGAYNYVGIGIMTTVVTERQRVTITVVFHDSPAEEAGLVIHDNILAVDGHPILDENGFRRDLILGPEGTSLVLTIQSPGQEPRQVSLIRRKITGNLPVPYSVLTSAGGKQIGYILIITLFDQNIPDQVQAALEDMSAESPLDGLIIDNRMNTGGSSNIFGDLLAFFTKGNLGDFMDRNQEYPLEIEANNVHGSQRLPLVVLVGQNTASFGEIFSGIMKDIGRAYLIGEVTDGNVEILRVYNFEDGSRAWIAHTTFRPLKHPEQDWEKSGIIPDLVVPSNWDEVTLQTDPAVLAALQYFDLL